MDPIRKQWWYEGWVYGIEKELEKLRAHGILIGSFTNPEAAQKLMKRERPDYASTDVDFERSYEMVEQAPETEKKPRKRRRKVIR